MAFSKQHKGEMITQYSDWLARCQAVFLLEYKGMTMKDIDTLRDKIRESGGEMHVVKNTLFVRAIDRAGLAETDEVFDGSTVAGFAFNDAAAFAKALHDATVKSEIFKVKGGFLGKQKITSAEVKALAELPPLPVVRAQLMGVLLAPASKLVRTLAEPGRSIAAVIKAYADKDKAAAELAS